MSADGALGRHAWRIEIGAALRRMRRAPRFFLGAALIVSLGVGAATAMSSLVEATLFRPPAFPDADRLVMLWSTRTGEERLDVSLSDFLDWQRRAQSYEQLALVSDWAFAFSVPGTPPTLEIGALVSGEYFRALGVQPLLGRLLQPEDDAAAEPCRLVLPAAAFRARLGGDPAWLGRTIELDGQPCTLVGVAEEGFDFCYPRHGPVALWATARPLWHDYDARARDGHDDQAFHVLGKLRSGVPRELAQAELAALAASSSAEHSGQARGAGLAGLQEELVLALRPRVWGLFAAIGCLFIASCTNTAGLFLVRAQSRRSEFALRSALGATRGRLLYQLLLEMALVFAVAAPGAWLLAQGFLAAFTAAVTTGLRGVADVAVDGRVLAGCLLLSSITGVLFGLGPALTSSRVHLGVALVEAGAGSVGSAPQRRWRGVLVAAQVAAASALLASSSTARHALERLARTPSGLDPEGIVAVFMSPSRTLYSDEALPGLHERLLAGLRARPGVVSATIASSLPLFGQTFEANFERVTAEPELRRDPQRFVPTVVRPGFFDTLRIPLLEGRDFDPSDGPQGPRVVIINETLRARYFPGQSPIGQRLRSDFWQHLEPPVPANGEPAEIIGVVGDVRRSGPQVAAGNQAFYPYSQYLPRTADVILRFEPTREAALAGQLPSWLRELEPGLPIASVRWSTRTLERGLQSERMLSQLLSDFAAACLALAALGVYVTVSYASAQRTREYGLRVALGASPWNIVWQVTRTALSWIALGLALGLAAVWVLAGVTARQIAGSPGFEPLVFARAAGVVALVAVLACATPALRALRLVPASALRRE